MQNLNNSLAIRDARDDDLPALVVLKSPEAIHRDRIRDAAASPGFRYLVLVKEGMVIGFACLVSVYPPAWPDAGDTAHLPQIIDLLVAPGHRRRGYGSFFIRAMETLVKDRGNDSLHISVEYPANAEAHALYLRFGYRQIQPEPYLKQWHFTDSGGEYHSGDEMIVDMVKSL